MVRHRTQKKKIKKKGAMNNRVCAMTPRRDRLCGECWGYLYFQDAIGGGACPPLCRGENGGATGEGGGKEKEEDVDFKELVRVLVEKRRIYPSYGVEFSI